MCLPRAEGSPSPVLSAPGTPPLPPTHRYCRCDSPEKALSPISVNLLELSNLGKTEVEYQAAAKDLSQAPSLSLLLHLLKPPRRAGGGTPRPGWTDPEHPRPPQELARSGTRLLPGSALAPEDGQGASLSHICLVLPVSPTRTPKEPPAFSPFPRSLGWCGERWLGGWWWLSLRCPLPHLWHGPSYCMELPRVP